MAETKDIIDALQNGDNLGAEFSVSHVLNKDKVDS